MSESGVRPAAFVTGAAQGIGAAIALGLARAGYDVAVSSRAVATLDDIAAQIEAAGSRALGLELDVQSLPNVKQALDDIWRAFGQLDVLISGVGLVHGLRGDVIHAAEERWHRATSTPNTGKSIRMAITSRAKEGQVLFYQAGGGE